MAQNIPPALEDIFYELRMLLGAAEMCKLEGAIGSGNVINYFKDSAYLHARILYEFFTDANYQNDASIVQFGGHPTIAAKLYSEPFRNRLNRRVMHMNHSRSQNTTKEPEGATQLNEQVQDIADDIRQLFQKWINTCTDVKFKAGLIELVDEAESQAENDTRGR